jgi:hypothetical protein
VRLQQQVRSCCWFECRCGAVTAGSACCCASRLVGGATAAASPLLQVVAEYLMRAA